MTELSRYFISSFGVLLPLINAPGAAVTALGMVGVGNKRLYQCLARKVAINAACLLVLTGSAGPYL